MRLWKLNFDEERYADESPHDFSWGSANHATPEDVAAWLIEHGAEIVIPFEQDQPEQPYDKTRPYLMAEPGRYLVFRMDEQ